MKNRPTCSPILRGAGCESDRYLVVAKLREGQSYINEQTQKFYVQKPNYAEITE